MAEPRRAQVVDELIPIGSLLFLSKRVASPRGCQKMRVIAGVTQCFKLADQQVQPCEFVPSCDLSVCR
jgi:hypothetical protein